jgi:two-component system, cell cycle sensor histidine kinase and response regulator CckA
MNARPTGREGEANEEEGPLVLVVDDEPGVRRLVVRILERAGYRAVAAAEAREAEALFDRHRASIRLLVTDIVMPETSGRVLARSLLRRSSGLRVILMSGFAPEPDAGDTSPPLDAPFIAKPFSPDSLLREVRGALGG